MSSNPNFDARIEIADGLIHYRIEKKKLEFPIEDIRLIGEFSAEPGMFAADYFFTFIVRGFKKPLDIPGYCEGIFQVLSELKAHLDDISNPKLQMSTMLDSNILFPAKYAGTPLYSFTTEIRPLINFPLLRSLVEVEEIQKKINPDVVLG